MTLIIPYVLPFYLILAFIEDSGLPDQDRRSCLTVACISSGLHGKAIIPLILGYGCNIPADIFLQDHGIARSRKRCWRYLVTFVPCTARTVVILGLVAAFVNVWWALAPICRSTYILIIIVGRIAFKAMPGESVGLIMEMADYHVPSLKVIAKQTVGAHQVARRGRVPGLHHRQRRSYRPYTRIGILNPINAAPDARSRVGWLGTARSSPASC